MEDQRIPCKSCGTPSIASIVEARSGLCIRCERAAIAPAINAKAGYYPTYVFLQANKSHTYRDQILAVARAISIFLTVNSLSEKSLTERFQRTPESFDFYPEDLNELGERFIQSEFHRWLGAINRWAPSAERSTDAYLASLNKWLLKYKNRVDA